MLLRRTFGLFVAILLSLPALSQSDFCATATPLTACTAVPGTNAGSTFNSATDDSYAAADICAASVENTIWYTFTAGAAGTYNINFNGMTCTNGFGAQIGALTGPCGGPYTSLNCMYVASGANGTMQVVLAAGQQFFLVVDGDGGDNCSFTVDVCSAACAADAGTVTVTDNGVVVGDTAYLCSDGTDCLDLTSNNDFVLPVAQPGEIAELMYALYTCPPTTNDPGTDPCYSGSLWSGQDFNDCNPSTYGLTGTYYFVPITADDGDDGGDPNGVINYDQNGDGCFDLGTPIVVYYLNDITFVETVNCNNGTVQVTISGGSPEVDAGTNYTITNTGSGTITGTPVGHGGTVTITGLTNGDSYSFTVSDPEGCGGTFAGGTFATALITNIAAVDPATCGGNGTVTVTATGTGNPIQYSSDNGVSFQGSNVFSLPAGTYDIVVEDANGCQATQQVTLTDPPSPSITNIASVDPTCGNNNGSITVTASGGTAPLTYSNDNGVTFQAGNAFTSLAPGTYDIVVEDANGCQATQQVTITDQPGPTITNIATVDPTCGNNNGSITVTATGGTAPLNYSNDNGVTFQAGNAFTSLGAGTYDIVVEDANGCQATQQVVLTDPGNPTITNIAAVDPTCGNNNGSITVTASGGTAPLNYSNDNGVTFQAGNAFTSLAPGTYDIVVEDANGCQATQQVTITDQPGATITNIASVDPTCGNNNGSITVTASGGTAPLNYSNDNGVTFQAGNAFTSLGAGTYDIVVEDANGCQTTQQIVLTDPGNPNITNIASVDPTCGNNNGSITITASGGTAPLSYSIDNGVTFQAGNAFTSLAPGTYDIVVEDAVGCQATQQVTITDQPGATITNIATVDPTCGNSNGSITVTASGGTAPLSYSNDNGVTFQAGNAFTGLPAGVYDIVVEDANGCQATQQVTISAANGPTITNVAVVDPVCGAADGNITITAIGGTAPLNYSNDNGVTFQASNAFTLLTAGTYDLVVEDANGCQVIQQVILTTSLAATIDSFTVVPPTCNGDTDGSLTIHITGGTAPITYSIDNGVTFGPSNVFNALGAGIYDVVVDANGCQSALQATIVDPAAVTYTEVVVDETCGAGDGSITLTAGGGDGGPYNYSIDGGATFQGTGAYANLSAGSFSVVITDNAGCQTTGTVIVNSTGAAVVLDSLVTADALCFGSCDGTVTAFVSGGTPPYNYQWFDNGGNPIGGNTATLSSLCAGNYSVTITDAAGSGGTNTFWSEGWGTGCSQNNSANGHISLNGTWTVNTTVGANDPFANEFFVSATEAGLSAGSCGDGCLANPALTSRSLHIASVAGSPASALFCPTGDCGAAYDASVTSNARAESPIIDCSGQVGITINFDYMHFGEAGDDEASLWYFDGTTWAPMVSPLPQTACCGGPCGGLNGQGQWAAFTTTLPASADNNPNVRLGFQWTNSNNNSGSDPSFAVDSIELQVTTVGGCPVSSALTINEPPVMSYTAVVTDAGCAGPGSIDITAQGGDGGPYQYSIDNGTTFQANNVFGGLAAGTYDIVVTDGNGCQITGTETIVTTGNPPVIDAVANTDPNCNGGSDGTIDITVSSGTPPFQYSIDGGTTLQASNSFTGLPAGTYDIYVIDAAGCVVTTQIVLNDPTVVTCSATVTDVSCLGGDGSIQASVSGGFAPYQYSIDNGATFQGTGQFNNLVAGTYTIIVEDDNGCQCSTTATVNTDPPVVAGFTANPTSGPSPLFVDFTNTSTGATSYTWDFGDGNGSTATDPSNTYMNDGTYTASMIATNGTCSDTASVTITVFGESSITMPNVFSPNGDGENDVFRPMTTNITDLSGTVWNRWGQILFTFSGPADVWDGYTNPGGKLAPEGTYYYAITAEGADGETYDLRGHITLVR